MCKEERNVSDFAITNRNTDGLDDHCKVCRNNRNKYSRPETGEFTCIKCSLTKDVSMFESDARSKSGLKGTCRHCIDICRAKLDSKLHNFINRLYINSKSKAKERGHEHNITKDCLTILLEEQKQICVGTGYVMTHTKNPPDLERGLKVALPNYYNISIDRISSNSGYIKRNIQLCTVGYNLIKGELDEDFLYDIARNITEYDRTPDKLRITSIIERFIKNKFNDASRSLPHRTRSIRLDITREDLYAIFEKQGGLCSLSGRSMTFYTSSRLRSSNGYKRNIKNTTLTSVLIALILLRIILLIMFN
uniref:Zn-finger protein n=1 Tax=Pithovirus LCPAC401 TaxID=2506595 RepID=A0A481ZA93_9VIRU|nr:MAG: Zn-finger protein [Pithovirus LCPAC401]